MGYMNYEERLEVAKRLYELSNDEQKTALECIFPELVESEDEKVREDIISLVNEFWERIGSINPEYSSRSRMLDWLEKQGESYTKRDVDDAFVEGMALSKNELEKQGEKKSSDEVLKIRQELYQSGYNDGYKHGCEDTKKQGEQKPAWSKEDEVYMCDVIAFLEDAKDCRQNALDCINWLKTIKERIGGQYGEEI